MKLERITSEQFAGVQNRELDFSEGMNVVLGDNESGKSTMISAMFHGLTTPAKLDKRRNREFSEQSFPTNGADTIDVALTFRQGEAPYTLMKVWDRTGENTETKLKQPVGGLLRGSQAENRLRELLGFGPAIYDYLVFGRQKNEATILDWCYRFFENGGDADMASFKQLVAGAFSAVDGISPEHFLKLLDDREKKLSGHWDFERDQPEKGRDLYHNNPWATGKGTILEAYYAWQQAQKDLQEAERHTEELHALGTELDRLNGKKEILEEQKSNLLGRQGRIEGRSKTRQLLKNAETALKRASAADESWPMMEARKAEADRLSGDLAEAKRRAEKAALEERRREVAALREQVANLDVWLDARRELPADCEEVRRTGERLHRSQGQLAAARLRAEAELEAGVTVEVETASGVHPITGAATLDVDGFAELRIPGVGRVRIVPQELDVDSLRQTIADCQAVQERLFGKWQAQDVDQLTSLAAQVKQKEVEAQRLRTKLTELVRDGDEEQLADKTASIQVDMTREISKTLQTDTADFLARTGQSSPEAAAAGASATLENLVSEYGSRAALSEKMTELMEQVKTYSAQLEETEEEDEIRFRQTMDDVKTALEQVETQRATALQRKGALDQQQPDLAELEADRDRCEKALLAEKETWKAYEQIREDFEELRADAGDRLAGFTALFGEYLSTITGQRLAVEPGEGLRLCSGENRLTQKELLSEGTRKTVLLAFRLAVLETFFPKGGGLVVLDDDLLDMDPGRRTQAAKLLQRFAEHNQVIFTTCDPEIANLLGGNRIQV